MMRALAVATLAAALVAGCGEHRPPNPDRGDVVESPEQVARSFVVTQSDGGIKKWDLRAAEGKIYDGGDLILLSDLSLDFFDSAGAFEGTLTAKEGRVLKHENRIEVRSSVLLRSREGGELRTDSLAWSEESGRITTGAYVESDRDGERLSGWGLTARPDLTFAEVTRDVTVRGTREER